MTIPIPQGFRDPSALVVRTIAEQLIGSVALSKSGTLAVAYTTALPIESIVLVDLATGRAPRGVRLRKAVRAVALADDGQHALVLHSANPRAGAADEEARIDASEGYSMVDTDLDKPFAKLQLTNAAVDPRELLITPSGTRLFALQRDVGKDVRAVDRIDLESFVVSSVSFSKPPTSLGLLALSPEVQRVFVGQAAEGGMITFLDANSGERVSDVSGFEIASRIRQ